MRTINIYPATIEFQIVLTLSNVLFCSLKQKRTYIGA